ncbi:hypothetical protein HYS93_01820 [Candidatus Daviesbacteria bacterium]|nr:hypothetical protein [Candidatus Daviesbacteria bacterium]
MTREVDQPLQENCGIAAAIAPSGVDASPIAAKLAYELQHRGQEGGGIGSKKVGGSFSVLRAGQRFGQAFSSPNIFRIALGHTRYRTTGPSDDSDYAQPIYVDSDDRSLMGIHNGNLANFTELHEQLKSAGVSLKTENKVDNDGSLVPVSDSEVLFNRIARASGEDWPSRVIRAMEGVEGAVSAVIATDQDQMIAFRDPWGIRPLSFGRLNGHWVVASETTPLDKLGVVDQTEIDKGEMWIFESDKDPQRLVYDGSRPKRFCDFEDWYFSWPASRRNGKEEELIREACGYFLAQEEIVSGRLVDADLVTSVPDTGRSSAVTFAEALQLSYRDRVYKERYDDKGGRGFIGSNPLLRAGIMDDKYLYSSSLAGKVVYLVDDTGVRLETIKIISQTLKERVGVRQAHIRFSAPKFVRPCFLGVNIHNRSELGAVEFRNGLWVVKSNEQIAQEIGADSVAFLTMAGRRRVREYFGESVHDFCGYCHGDEGPNFDWLKYDPDILLEQYNH